MSPEPDRDLLVVGEHCSAQQCNQVDFLPFRCAGCANVFCLEHRSVVAHDCPHAGASQSAGKAPK